MLAKSFLNELFPNVNYQITTIPQGSTDKQTYLVTSDNKPYILQILAENLNFAEEIICSQYASDYSLGAKILIRRANMILYVALTPIGVTYHQLATDKILNQIIQNLLQQHARVSNSLPKAANVIERCQQLPVDYSMPMVALEKLQIIFTEEKSVFIHGDLNHSNISYADPTARFIDWTYAGMGCRYDDLAEIAVYFYPSEFEKILTLYFGAQYTDAEYQKLYHAWLGRLILFATWALHRARTQFSYSDDFPNLLQLGPIDITAHLQALANGEEKLDTAEKLLLFASAALQAFHRCL